MSRELALITTSFPVDANGREAAGSFVADLAIELSRAVSVRVIAPGPTATREPWHPNIEVFRYAAPDKPLSTLNPTNPKDVLDLYRVLCAGRQATLAAVVGGSVGHILALWALPSGYWAKAAAVRANIGYSVWMLGSDVWTLGRIPLVRNMLARVMRGASERYADGVKLAEDSERLCGRTVNFLPSARALGAISHKPAAASPPYRFLFLGRWHPNKGIDLLLDSLLQLTNEDWRGIASIEIQGGGSLEDMVRNRIAELRESGRPVELGAFLSKEQSIAAMLRADWVVIPSRIESIPLIYSDAMACARPVIVTPVGDMERLVRSGKTGIVCAGTAPEHIAAAIRSALSAVPSAFEENVKRASDDFSVARVAQTFLRHL